MAGCWYIMRGLWLSVSMIHVLSAVREGCCSWSWGLSSLACGSRKGCPPLTVVPLTAHRGYCWIHMS